MLRALGQLAARELGLPSAPAAALAPRLPSRYEHADAASIGHPSYEEALQHTVGADAHAQVGAMQAPDRAAEPLSRADDVSPSTNATKRIGVEAETHERLEGRDKPGRRETHISETASPDRSADSPHTSATAAPLPRQLVPRSRRDGVLPSPVPAPRHENASVHGHKHQDMETRPVVATASAEPRTPVRDASALRPLAPPPLPARASPGPSTAAAPVHITIGRLEIRATKEPAAAVPAAQRSASTRSLSAYLRRRSDGGRS